MQETFHAGSETSPWSWRRLSLFALAVFALHATLMFSMVERKPAAPRQADHAPMLQLGGPPAVPRERTPLVSAQDPTVFALPHPHGFSGPAWFGSAATPHALAEIQTAPKFLEGEKTLQFSLSALPTAPLYSTLQNQSMPRNRPLAAPELRGSRTNTTIHILGDLRHRPLLAPLLAGPQRHTDVLSNTVVQVAVNADGAPTLARLVTSSGSRPADLEALRQARSARFKPLEPQLPGLVHDGLAELRELLAPEPRELAWGEIVYQWHTLPPPPPANPPPAK